MNFSKFRQDYWTDGGRVRSFHLDVEKNTAEIELILKRKITPGKERIYEEDLIPCVVRLSFRQLIEISLFDEFPTDGYYLEFITGGIGNGNDVELSINVFDSSSHVHERPNWTIKAKRVLWEEI